MPIRSPAEAPSPDRRAALRAAWHAAALTVGALALLAVPARHLSAQPLATALDSVRVEAALRTVPPAQARPLRAFYTDQAYRAVWTHPAGTTPYARVLQRLLRDAEADGLPLAAYAVPDDACRRTPAGALADRAACEVAHAAALLRYADALARGRGDPERLYRAWEAERPPLDARHLLERTAADGPAVALAEVRPAHADYARLRTALARYRALADSGGWPAVLPGPVLHPGEADPRVRALRIRLAATDSLLAVGPAPSEAQDAAARDSTQQDVTYNAELERAVRRFQARHGLVVDGLVGPATRVALNVSAAARARQLALAMERWRWLPADLGPRYLLVNAAGQTLDLVEAGAPPLRLRTIVGTRRDPTPAFQSRVRHAVFSPYWNVPESIAREEIWPRVRQDPSYLARHDMHVLSSGRIRQDPGPANPLGPVKFIFANRFGVRLHGTAQPALFERPVRAFSHGCIRVEEPLTLAVRLLQDPDWTEARAVAVVDAGRETWVPLHEPVPLYVGYWTAWVEPDGTVHFRSDLYGHDAALVRALGGAEVAAVEQGGGAPQAACEEAHGP